MFPRLAPRARGVQVRADGVVARGPNVASQRPDATRRALTHTTPPTIFDRFSDRE